MLPSRQDERLSSGPFVAGPFSSRKEDLARWVEGAVYDGVFAGAEGEQVTTSDRMRIEGYEFGVQEASFRYARQSWSGPGWDFTFRGPCLNDRPQSPLFPYGACLFTEASPLPLQNLPDLVGQEVVLAPPFDDESGEPYFGIQVMEEHQVSNLRLRFVEQKGQRYRIEITATVAPSVLGFPATFELSAWAERLPDHAYPVGSG